MVRQASINPINTLCWLAKMRPTCFGALYAYRCKSRKSDVMNGMAASLTDQDMADLAAYYMNSEVQP